VCVCLCVCVCVRSARARRSIDRTPFAAAAAAVVNLIVNRSACGGVRPHTPNTATTSSSSNRLPFAHPIHASSSTFVRRRLHRIQSVAGWLDGWTATQEAPTPSKNRRGLQALEATGLEPPACVSVGEKGQRAVAQQQCLPPLIPCSTTHPRRPVLLLLLLRRRLAASFFLPPHRITASPSSKAMSKSAPFLWLTKPTPFPISLSQEPWALAAATANNNNRRPANSQPPTAAAAAALLTTAASASEDTLHSTASVCV
jgi:hypothetical protein